MTKATAQLPVGGRQLCFCVVVIICAISLFSAPTSAQTADTASEQIKTGTVEQKRNALSLIRNLRTESASVMAIPALSDANEIVRAMAAAAIIFLPPDQSTILLVPLLTDKSEFVRREAAAALGEGGSAGASQDLIRTLQNDRDHGVRAAAAAALGKVGDPSAVPSLLTVLGRKPSTGDEYLRRSAARSIGQIAEAVRGIRRRTVTPGDFLPEKYKSQRTVGSSALSPPALTAAVPVLLKVAANRSEADDTRREAAFALGAIGDPAAARFFKENLNNKDPYLAEICREGLLKLPTLQ